MRASVCSRLVVIVTVAALLPGAGEILEAVAHVVEVGELAHDSVAHEHESGEHGTGSEHGCSPTLHQCGCCARVSLVSPVIAAFCDLPTETWPATPRAAVPVTEGHARGQFRPPRAA